jgi:DNA-binding response OmpR family regulator
MSTTAAYINGVPVLLLIEDDAAVASLITDALKLFFSVKVLPAGTGQQARVLWAEHREQIAAIISDLNLPDESGMSIVRELLSDRPDVFAVIMTGYLYSETEVERVIGRRVGLLLKPFHPIELRKLFEPYLPARKPDGPR